MTSAILSRTLPDHPDVCRICLQQSKLTFEHIPPKSCYNKDQLQFYSLHTIYQRFQGPSKYRKGLGRKSLCMQCNNGIGSKYNSAFKTWTTQAMSLVQRLGDSANSKFITHPFTIYPGQIAKQIAFMTCATNDYDIYKAPQMENLRIIASNPNTHVRLKNVRVFCYLTLPKSTPRLNGICTRIHSGIPIEVVWAEIALAPLGYVVIAESPTVRKYAYDIGLCDITHFFNYTPIELYSDFLNLRVLNPVGASSMQYD